MKISRLVVTLLLITVLTALFPGASFCKNFSRVAQLFTVRDTITAQGNILPVGIKLKKGNDLRTLERIFELNTSSLTTLEAYFRMVMMAVSNKTETDPETVKILNGWLEFIENQCKYDIEFLDEALKETQDVYVREQITTAQKNIKRLSEIAAQSMIENNKMIN